MKKRIKVKNLLLTVSLAFAGLFGVSAFAVNKQTNQKQLLYQAKADSSDGLYERVDGITYRVIYFAHESKWETEKEFGGSDSAWRFLYSTDNGSSYTDLQFNKNNGEAFSEIIGVWLAKIYLPQSTTNIKFRSRDNSSDTRYHSDDHTLSASDEGVINYRDYYNKTGLTDSWVSDKDTILDNYILGTFTVSCNWYSGESNIGNDYVGSYSWSATNSDASNVFRSIGITNNMIHQWNGGKHYAELLIPVGDGNTLINMQSSFRAGAQYSNGEYTSSGSLASGKLYQITAEGNVISKASMTYTVMPTSSFYLVGHGSFASADWTTAGGVQMEYANPSKGALSKQHLEEGDTFKVTDGSSWYGWDSTNGVWNIDFDRGVYYNLKYTANGWDNSNFKLTEGTYSSANRYGPVSSGVEIYFECNDSTIYGGDANLVLRTFDGYYHYGEYITGSKGSACLIKYTVEYSRLSCGFQFVRHADDYSWTNYSQNACNADGIESKFNYEDGTICTKKEGNYNITCASDGKIHISNSSYDEMYLDLNGINWEESNHKIAAHFWNSYNNESLNVKMNLVHGHGGSTRVFETIIPTLANGKPNYVLFYSYSNFSETDMGDMGSDYHKKTGDILISEGNNMYRIDGWDSGDNVCPSSGGGEISNTTRANYYGAYVMSEAICSGMGSVTATQTNWNNIWDEYNNINTDAQGKIWVASSSIAGTQLEQGMARYDVIVSKYGMDGAIKYYDFINRQESGGYHPYSLSANHNFNPFVINDESSFSTIIIVIASSVSLLSITALSVLVIKKRKSKEQ